MKRWLISYWRILTRSSVHFSLGFLTLGGFIAGVFFWGGFNTAVEATNSQQFCIACHEMERNPYREMQGTIHDVNRSGVGAQCKMEASKEVWGWIFGTIRTEAQFEAKRRELAEREWARLEANDSLECRNCHDFDSMDFTLQSSRAARAHSTTLAEGEAIATRVSPTSCPI